MRQMLFKKDGKGIFVEKFCVHPEFRRKGFGGIIQKVTEEFGKENNYKYIQWNTLKTNVDKVKFDRNKKAQIIGESDLHYKIVKNLN